MMPKKKMLKQQNQHQKFLLPQKKLPYPNLQLKKTKKTAKHKSQPNRSSHLKKSKRDQVKKKKLNQRKEVRILSWQQIQMDTEMSQNLIGKSKNKVSNIKNSPTDNHMLPWFLNNSGLVVLLTILTNIFLRIEQCMT